MKLIRESYIYVAVYFLFHIQQIYVDCLRQICDSRVRFCILRTFRHVTRYCNCNHKRTPFPPFHYTNTNQNRTERSRNLKIQQFQLSYLADDNAINRPHLPITKHANRRRSFPTFQHEMRLTFDSDYNMHMQIVAF